MIGSERIKRLVVLRERMRDAERTGHSLALRALAEAESDASRAAKITAGATSLLGATREAAPDALALLSQAVREAGANERILVEQKRLRARELERQEHTRVAAERDVKLAELAHGRASKSEDAEREKRLARIADDRAASVWRRR